MRQNHLKRPSPEPLQAARCATDESLREHTFVPEALDAGGRNLWRARITSGLFGCLALLSALGCGGGAKGLTIPVVYVVAGRVIDPATSPVAGVPGARVSVETAPGVQPVTSDADGNFVLQGLAPGVHRLRAELSGRRTTLTYDFRVTRNLADTVVPLFTDAEIDSVLAANGAPPWNRAQALLGVFALKSTGVPLGDALVSFAAPPGGALVQTGEGKDPIVLVNANPGDASLLLARGGYVWDGPYTVALRPGVVVFAAPRARPNFNGFVFANSAIGAGVPGALVEVLEGPTPNVQSTTNFLAQFSLVGLSAGRYVARIAASGFLPTVTWPQQLDQDTTLAQVLVEPDTLAAWAGSTAIDPAKGHLRVDARDLGSGAVRVGATVDLDPLWGSGPGATGRVLVPQTPDAPALLLNLPPGIYRAFARVPGNDSPATDSVRVRAGEVTSTRIDF